MRLAVVLFDVMKYACLRRQNMVQCCWCVTMDQGEEMDWCRAMILSLSFVSLLHTSPSLTSHPPSLPLSLSLSLSATPSLSLSLTEVLIKASNHIEQVEVPAPTAPQTGGAANTTSAVS